MQPPSDANTKGCEDESELLKAIFQAKWRFRVLRELATAPMRLSSLRRAIPECSKKVLIDTLHSLESLSLIRRVDYSTKVKRVEYQLNEGCADDVRRIIENVSTRSFPKS